MGHFRKVKGREAKRCRAVQLKEKVDTDSTDKWPSQKMSITESKSEKESERPLITSDTLVQLLVMFPKFPLKFSFQPGSPGLWNLPSSAPMMGGLTICSSETRVVSVVPTSLPVQTNRHQELRKKHL